MKLAFLQEPVNRLHKEVGKISECCTRVWIQEHDCGARVETYNSCRSKFCPRCFHKWTEKSRSILEELCATWAQPKHITLTAKTTTFGNLKDFKKRLDEAFRLFRLEAAWKEYVRSAFRFVGLTVRPRGRWHFHYHVFADVSRWLELEELREFNRVWVRCCAAAGLEAGERATKIRTAWSIKGAVDECLKGTKGDMLKLRKAFKDKRRKNGEQLFAEVLEALRGVPWFRALAGACKALVNLKKTRPKWVKLCPRCGKEYVRSEWESYDTIPQEEHLRRKYLGGHWGDHYHGFVSDYKKSEEYRGISRSRLARICRDYPEKARQIG